MENKELHLAEELRLAIENYYSAKTKSEDYKKFADTFNKQIKEVMKILNKTEFETTDGLIAKVTTQNRESFDEPALIQKLKEIDKSDVIDLVEVINWDKVEDMIYNGKLDATILSPYKQTKEIVTLKVNKKKGK